MTTNTEGKKKNKKSSWMDSLLDYQEGKLSKRKLKMKMRDCNYRMLKCIIKD